MNVCGGRQWHAPCKILLPLQINFLCLSSFVAITRLLQGLGNSDHPQFWRLNSVVSISLMHPVRGLFCHTRLLNLWELSFYMLHYHGHATMSRIMLFDANLFHIAHAGG